MVLHALLTGLLQYNSTWGCPWIRLRIFNQNAAARLLAGVPLESILKQLYWSPAHFHTQFKALSRQLRDQGCFLPYRPSQVKISRGNPLVSSTTHRIWEGGGPGKGNLETVGVNCSSERSAPLTNYSSWVSPWLLKWYTSGSNVWCGLDICLKIWREIWRLITIWFAH